MYSAQSDGMQVVSEISSRLVLHPDAHILFLTSSRFREVIEASAMNKELTKLLKKDNNDNKDAG